MASTTGLMKPPDLIAALLLGVLLPLCFSRPAFLSTWPMTDERRRRWQFAYSAFAFAAMGFIYVAATLVLRPVHGLTTGARNALDFGGLILLAIACFHHLPPVSMPGRRLKSVVTAAVALLGGLAAGGFAAVDQIDTHVHNAWIGYATWAGLALILITVGSWFGGPSPEQKLKAFVRRRERTRRRRRRACRPVGPTPELPAAVPAPAPGPASPKSVDGP